MTRTPTTQTDRALSENNNGWTDGQMDDLLYRAIIQTIAW